LVDVLAAQLHPARSQREQELARRATTWALASCDDPSQQPAQFAALGGGIGEVELEGVGGAQQRGLDYVIVEPTEIAGG